jgi:uncharacterized caspase-like protein
VLTSVAERTEPDDLLLFYYTGHGDEHQVQSYLVTHDGMKESLGYTAASLSEVQAILQKAPAQRKIMLLDACHVGIRDTSKGVQPFSEAFIKRVFEEAHLKGEADFDQKGFVTVEDIHRYVSDKVKMAASWDHHLQTPSIEAKMVGDIICVDFRQQSSNQRSLEPQRKIQGR